MSFSFIHTADIHLGRAFSDINIELTAEQKNILRTAHEKALEDLGAFAVDKSVDFILIAGDTFDDSEHDLRSKIVLTRFLKKMEKEEISVYMVCGNHDPSVSYTNELVFKDSSKINIFGVNRPLEPMSVKLNSVNVAKIYPFGFATTSCLKSPCEFLQKAQDKTVFNIGLIHCDMTTSNNVYAPCSETSLRVLDYDYYALGHIHKPLENDKFVYSGTIQGRSKKDVGEHGFRYVTVENGEILVNDFITCDKVRYYDLEHSVTEDESSVETFENIHNKIEDYLKGCRLVIINLTLVGVCKYPRKDLLEIKKTILDERVVLSVVEDNTVSDVDDETILSSGGVLAEIMNICSDSEELSNVVEKINKDFKSFLSVAESLPSDEVVAGALNELKNICANVYSGGANE